ncbi:MAG TPA: AI-2E family transporter, partial [Anaerolineae bacterium]|nr:AI-2E family transporter [Anaerolineae bacterium]
MNTQWDAPTKRIVAVGLGLFFIYVLILSRSVLPFLIIAALIAFLLAPIVNFLNQKLYLPKALAVIIAYLLMALFLTLFPLILIPAVLNAFGDINIDWVALLQQLLVWARTTLESWRTIRIWDISYDLSGSIDPALEALNNISPTQFIPSLDTVI